MSVEFIFQIAVALASAIAASTAMYAAIKSDLVKALHVAESAANEADSCHQRLDRHIEVKH